MTENIQTLFNQALTVVNVGLPSFAESLAEQQRPGQNGGKKVHSG